MRSLPVCFKMRHISIKFDMLAPECSNGFNWGSSIDISWSNYSRNIGFNVRRDIGSGYCISSVSQTLLGYDPGPVDGAWGSKTRTALEVYYAGLGREFSGQLGVRDYGTLLAALENEILSRYPSENARPLNLAARFQAGKDVWFPAQYAFAEGADTPAREERNLAVLHPYVHDLDGDG
ncbi:peptidoglycan-binding domain-containing protein [Devosia sp. CAU 1758]